MNKTLKIPTVVIGCIALVIALISLLYSYRMATKLIAAEQTINELRSQKDPEELSARIDALTSDNQRLQRELLSVQQLQGSDEHEQAVTKIEEDLKTAISLLIDRNCTNVTLPAADKEAYTQLKDYCTDAGFKQLVPNYDLMDKLPSDPEGYVININQWASDFDIWTKFTSANTAKVFCFYKYNNIPHGSQNNVKSNYAMCLTMIYNADRCVWQIGHQSYNELIQSKFNWYDEN